MHTIWKKKPNTPWQSHGGRFNGDDAAAECKRLQSKGWITELR